MNYPFIPFLSIVVLNLHLESAGPAKLYPLIMIPGYQGSQLYAQTFDNASAPLYCRQKPGPWLLWLGFKEFIPILNQCWLYAARLYFDENSGTSLNSPGVKIIVRKFGSLASIEDVNYAGNLIKDFTYFRELIKQLIAVGYRRDENLLGAPYDWRKSMNEQGVWFGLMKQLVERVYTRNSNQKVILLGHSMGGNMAYVFLKNQTQEWKDKYIRLMFTLGTPWMGNFKYLYGFLFADDDQTAQLTTVVRSAERTFPSFAFLMPKAKYWGKDTIFISSPQRNYTPSNYEQFFNDIGSPKTYSMWSAVNGLMGDLEHPRVEIYCYGGVGVQTLRALIASSNNMSDLLRGKVVHANGDGYVNIESLEYCLRWGNQSNHQFRYKAFKAAHLDLIRDPVITEAIASDISQIS